MTVRTCSRTSDNSDEIPLKSDSNQDDAPDDELDDPMDEEDLELDAIYLCQAVDLEVDIHPDHREAVDDAA